MPDKYPDISAPAPGMMAQPLNGPNMRLAFVYIATYLTQNDIHLDLVAVGQTCTVLRQPDHLTELDCVNGEIQLLHNVHPAATTYQIIREAVRFACRNTGINLEGRWIDHECKYHHQEMDRQLPVRGLEEPRTTDVIIVQDGGLTVFDGSLRGTKVKRVTFAL